MLDIHLLGTSGTVPLPHRWLTSLLVRWEGHECLIDCGEGTQIALAQQNVSPRHIDTILLTHYHADHTAGLPGLLLSMAKANRTEPVTIVGPKGLQQLISGVLTIARYIPFNIEIHELSGKGEKFMVENLEVQAFGLKHSVPCYGYEMYLPRRRKFQVDKAKGLNIPLRAWNPLQKGNTIKIDGITYTPDMVLGEERKGLKVVYATDTRPNKALLEHSLNADLLITEGMYGDPEKLIKAKENQHMMMSEACKIAKDAQVKELWLTHYSPSMEHPRQYTDMVEQLFQPTIIAKDGQSVDLNYDES